MRHIYMDRCYLEESDAALVTQVLAGKREAFDVLVARYYASLLRLCVRLLSDPIQAQDIAQESLLQAFLGLDRLQKPARFGAWLHAIAANLARSSLRRLRTISLDEMESNGQPAFRHATSFPSVEQVAALRETHDAILAALMELSIVNREVVIGYYLEGYNYAELANLLRVPVSTVKSRLFKGRQQMRQHLDGLRQPVQDPTTKIQKESPMTPELIPLQIETICEYPLTQRSIVVLRTLTDDRYLPIKLSPDEAIAIERVLKNQPSALPVPSQDTLLQLVSRLGGRIEQIIIRSLMEQNYYASLILAQKSQQHEVDCRLSDALLLAARAQIPIQVAPALLQEAGVTIASMDTNPAVTGAEPSDEPVMTSEQWPETLVEHVWAFLLSMLYRDRTPHDLSRLRSIDWSEIFPARKFSWENQTMQVVQLPGSEPAWLVVHPQVWNQISAFVEWVQHRNPRQVEDPQPLFVPLDGGLQKQIEELLEEAWPGLTNLGVRSLTLMHLNGQLVSWKSLDGYESAAFMGRAAVRDLVLTRHLNALVHAEAEPMIKLTYERSPIFNPAQAAGTRVVSTSETLIHDAWLLVIGWAADRQLQGQQQFFTQIQANLEALLPN
jgi:RNA polymerase sigma-70 factor (ECF subfamily)